MKVALLLALCALAAATPQNPSDANCDQCLQIVKYIDGKLTANATEQDVEDVIDKICDDLGSAADECKSYVSQYVPEVFKMVAAKIDPQTICQELHICNKTRRELLFGPGPVIGGTGLDLDLGNNGEKPIMPSGINIEEIAPQHPDGELCVICEFVIKEVQSQLGTNATVQEIEQVLEKVCNILPSTVKSECVSFVDQYAPQIINLLVDKLDPEQICTALGLCNSTLAQALTTLGYKQAPRNAKAGVLCPVCEQAMKYVESMLANNATEQEIIHVIEKICEYLPEADRQQCKTLIDTEGEQIINMLVNKVSPKVICTAIRLCESSGKAVQEHRQQN